MKSKKILFIYGPTGVGKSALAERIAKLVPSEIVNMDVGQFYKPLTIGTAKPDLSTVTVPHHLYDILEKPVDYTVIQYRNALKKVCDDILRRNKTPIVVGGSGFYLKSLFFLPSVPTKINVLPEDNQDNTWETLHAIDPDRAAVIDPKDRYRIARALHVWRTTGIRPSQYEVPFDPVYTDFDLIFLTRDREQLYKRINERVEHMFDEGWLSEVKQLRGTPWEPFLHRKRLIGYSELFAYLDHEQTDEILKSTVNTIKKRTRNYAKRQHTFWRSLQTKLQTAFEKGGMQTPFIATINLTLSEHDLYIKQLLKRI